MDGKVVSRRLRVHIRPVLRQAGFCQFTDRTAWRYFPDRIDVVNFESLNSYNAAVIGTTTYSFAPHLGCFFLFIPDHGGLKTRNGRAVPAEWQCHVRRDLHKGREQPELARSDIWYLDDGGGYLEWAIADVTRALIEQGLPWFDRFADRRELLRTLLEDGETDTAWGFGAKPSPQRALLTAYTALDLGDRRLALKELQWLAEQGSPLATESVLADLAVLKTDAPVA